MLAAVPPASCATIWANSRAAVTMRPWRPARAIMKRRKRVRPSRSADSSSGWRAAMAAVQRLRDRIIRSTSLDMLPPSSRWPVRNSGTSAYG